MLINTRQFGEIEIDDEKKITFIQGLPGFEELTTYALLQPNQEIPFSFLQSLEAPDISFIIANPFLFYPDYGVDLTESTKEEMKIQKEEDTSVWCMVSIRESVTDATVNLLAPIVLNATEKIAKQIILHKSPYQTKHKLIDDSMPQLAPTEV
ncbi:flagellar assembly protein FliW [Paenibacillus sp. TAF58]